MTLTETVQARESPRTGWGSSTGPEPGTIIEDHALLGDLYTAALVARDGSIDFLCLPDFDSDACFASLLGTPDNGRWKIAPKATVREVRHRYRGKTLIVETEFVTDEGAVRLVDFMPIRKQGPHLVRWVEGLRGTVTMRSDLRPRFANGYTHPLVSRRDGATAAVAGPDALYLRGGVGEAVPPFELEFTVQAGQRIPFVLSWARPYDDIPTPIDPEVALRETQSFWEGWASRLRLPSEYEDVVVRSLLTLKACSFRPTGALVAAPTFGLPETPGGERNWDYRFCWVRDAALTLNAFMRAGLTDEADAFGDWLENAIGGAPNELQIMYGIRGERRLTEVTLDWLQGYEGARPVRIGNGAYSQFQLDILGEFAAVLHNHMRLKGKLTERGKTALKTLAIQASEVWMQPDHGIWEMRGPKHAFTASKVSAWIAIDRWVRTIEEYGLEEDKAPWVELRQTLFDEVCSKGFDARRNTFTQYYGSKHVDASLLVIPLAGFLPPDDPRVVGTVKAIEEELMPEGLVLRYLTEGVDGLSGDEGAFLACSFWLASTYQLQGRHEDARRLFEKLLGLCNDVGLLAEEYIPGAGRQLGNFPQAFSHLALVSCAYLITEGGKHPLHS
ncbi:glycoside hydrolase family 15 protein [Corallococcus sp. ZKHCc1 1396]|uniref:Glycoside hydrolase family 15 protein n=1 Tax=Corallococcus soli TaxID=2710757 RepID=A0ABR9PYQ2_9BACT|nr:glycoside hydrolase family 15 protein [Corallococcus soli]MBE4753045.1 glycoside hydrolase family 15 protein [Corallococcus soli]